MIPEVPASGEALIFTLNCSSLKKENHEKEEPIPEDYLSLKCENKFFKQMFRLLENLI
jgi:hypothetical protein